jgi:hypothetical protein
MTLAQRTGVKPGQGFSKEKVNICITFDNVYANNHKYVLYLLAKYQLQGAFFITAIRNEGFGVLSNEFLGRFRCMALKGCITIINGFKKIVLIRISPNKTAKKFVEMLVRVVLMLAGNDESIIPAGTLPGQQT